MIKTADLDSASTQAMQDEIKLLNVKLDYLNDGSRRLHGLYDRSNDKVKNLQEDLDSCEKRNLAIRSEIQVYEHTFEGIDQTIFSNFPKYMKDKDS